MTETTGIVSRAGCEDRDGKEVFTITVYFPNKTGFCIDADLVREEIPVKIVPASEIASLRQQLAQERERQNKAEARIKELEEERQPITDIIAGLLNVYVRYEDSIDPDHETVEAINRGKAALEALREDLGTDVPPSSTGAKC